MKAFLRRYIAEAMQALSLAPSAAAALPTVDLRPAVHGDYDYSCTVALRLNQTEPAACARRLADQLSMHAAIGKADASGPGFINILVSATALCQELSSALAAVSRQMSPAVDVSTQQLPSDQLCAVASKRLQAVLTAARAERFDVVANKRLPPLWVADSDGAFLTEIAKNQVAISAYITASQQQQAVRHLLLVLCDLVEAHPREDESSGPEPMAKTIRAQAYELAQSTLRMLLQGSIVSPVDGITQVHLGVLVASAWLLSCRLHAVHQ